MLTKYACITLSVATFALSQPVHAAQDTLSPAFEAFTGGEALSKSVAPSTEPVEPLVTNCAGVKFTFANFCLGKFQGQIPFFYRAGNDDENVQFIQNPNIVGQLKGLGISYRGALTELPKGSVGCLFDFQTLGDMATKMPDGATVLYRVRSRFEPCKGLNDGKTFGLVNVTITKLADGPHLSRIEALYLDGLDSNLSPTASFGAALRQRYGKTSDDGPNEVNFESGTVRMTITRPAQEAYLVVIENSADGDTALAQLKAQADKATSKAPTPKF